MKLLFVVRDDFPSIRPDVYCLFGKYLPRSGVDSALVSQPRTGEHGLSWGGGELFLGRAGHSKIRGIRVLRRFLFDSFTVLTKAKTCAAIQVRDKILLGALALVLARLLRRPFYYWMSFPFPEQDIETAKKHKLSLGPCRLLLFSFRGIVTWAVQYKFLLRHAGHIFVQSEKMKSGLAAHGIPPEKMTAVPMCIDLEEYQEPPRREVPAIRELEGRRVVGYLGALDRVRGLDFLIEAFALLRAKVPEAILLLVGDANSAEDMRWLKEQALNAGVAEHVVYTGWLPRDEARSRILTAEVGVSPLPNTTVYDWSSPTKIIEYAALGIPSVVTDVADQSQVIAESRSGLCVGCDAKEFSSALENILRQPDLARQMGLNGLEYVKSNRNYRMMADKLSNKYRTLLS